MKRLHLLLSIVIMLFVYANVQAQSLKQIAEIFPDFQQSAEHSAYGISVDIEGNYAVVGANKYNNDFGAAFILEYDGTSWSQIATLTSSTPNKVDDFGSKVAITSELIIVTAPTDSTGGSDEGAVYLFEKPTSGWASMTESKKLTLTGKKFFGSSVDIDGDILAIGDKRDTYRGAVNIYKKSSTSGWQLLNHLGTLTPSINYNYHHFGQSVSISGNTILIGAYSPQTTGAAFVYEKPSSGWTSNTETAILTASDETLKDCFGFDVCLNGDIAIVGAYSDDNPKGADAGAVYAFIKPASGWVDSKESSKILHSLSSTGYNFGYSVDFDGSTLAVGMPSIGYGGVGYTVILSYSSNTFTYEETLVQKNVANGDYFGCSVAFSGNNFVTGSYNDNSFDFKAGGAEFHLKNATSFDFTHVSETFPPVFNNCINFRFGHSIDISGTTAVVGAYSEKPYGAAYVLEYNGSTWEKVAKLSKTNPGSNDLFGVRVAIDNNTIVVTATGANAAKGAAYVFEKPASGWTNMTETAILTTQGSFHFGVSAAINNNTIIIGDDYYAPSNRGAVFVFEKPASGWTDATETAKLTSSFTGSNQYFGISTDIDNDVIIVGNQYAYSSRGRVQVFIKPANGWVDATETAVLSRSNALPDNYLGKKVSICGDYILASAPNSDNVYTNDGVVYLYKKPETGWANANETLKLVDPKATSNNMLGKNYISITNNSIYLGIGNADSLLTITKQNSQTWTEVIANSFNPERIGLSKGYNDHFKVSGKYAIVSNANNDKISLNGGGIVILEKNQAPLINNQSLSIKENSTNGTAIGTLIATDPEGDNITYSITSGNHKNILAINTNTGEITVAYADTLDYEQDKSFTFTITASDASSSSSAELTVNLINENDNSPELANQSVNIDENTPQNTEIYNVVVNDADNDVITITIIDGNTNSAFGVKPDSKTIVIAKPDLIDYETTKQYILTLEANDGVNKTTSTLTINLNDLNDTPPTLVNNAFTIIENTYYNTIIDTIEAKDVEGDDITFKLLSSPVIYSLTVDRTTGIIRAGSTAIDYEKNKSLIYSILLSDGTNSDTVEITLNVLNVNDNSPIHFAKEISILENSPKGTIIDTLPFSDPDSLPLTFSIFSSTADGIFALDSTTGVLTVNKPELLDYELVKEHTITTKVNDGKYQLTKDQKISILNTNDNAPEVTNLVISCDENSVKGQALYSFNFTDIDNDNLDYSIIYGDTASVFSINNANNTIIVNKSAKLDFETYPQFKLGIQVTDGLHTDTSLVTINVNNLNDNAPIGDSIYISLKSNTPIGSILDTVKCTDADGDKIEYLISSGNQHGNFSINKTTGVLTLQAQNFNIETVPSYNLTISATDGKYTSPITIIINMVHVHVPPIVFNDVSFTIDENTDENTVIGSVTANDTINTSTVFAYSIINGNINDAFQINESTGELSVKTETVIDFEQNPVFNLTVNAKTDTDSVTTTVTINLNNINEFAPEFNDLYASVVENSPLDTKVCTLSATDADDDSLSYTIIEGAFSSCFTIDQTNGSINIANVACFDYETVDTLIIEVKVSDATYSTTAFVYVIIENANDNAPLISDQIFSIDENCKNYTFVDSIIATDVDGDELLITIENNSTNPAFIINPYSCELYVADSSQIDFELNKSIKFNVIVNDGMYTDTALITVNINDLNDSGITINDFSFNIEENSANGTYVGTISGIHENDSALFYYIINDTINAFAIDSVSGIITVANSHLLDYETITACYATLKASNGSGLGKANLIINIININDNAPVAFHTEFSIDENSANNTALGTIEASDLDNDNVTFSISDGNIGGTFSIDASTGELSIADNTALDYEVYPEFILTIDVTDGVFTVQAAITIILTDVFEPITNIKSTNMRKISIYPNPSSDYIVIDTENNETTAINIYNNKGQLVLKDQIDSRIIDIQTLESGLYLVHINNQVIKLVKD